jgi:hypothetical protein
MKVYMDWGVESHTMGHKNQKEKLKKWYTRILRLILKAEISEIQNKI